MTVSPEEPPSVTSELSVLVQLAKPASPISSLYKQLPNVYVFSAHKIFTSFCAPFPNRISYFKILAMPQVYVLCSLLTRTQESRDVAAAPQTPQLGGPRPTLGAQVSLKLLFGYVTIFSLADLFTTDLNCRKKLACDIISECNVILSRRI